MEPSTSKPISTKLDNYNYIVNHNISSVLKSRWSLMIHMNNTLSFQVIVDSKLSLEDYGLDELIPVAVSEQEFHRIQREIEEYLGIELEGGSSEGEHT